jgi:hypothetical protein
MTRLSYTNKRSKLLDERRGISRRKADRNLTRTGEAERQSLRRTIDSLCMDFEQLAASYKNSRRDRQLGLALLGAETTDLVRLSLPLSLCLRLCPRLRLAAVRCFV